MSVGQDDSHSAATKNLQVSHTQRTVQLSPLISLSVNCLNNDIRLVI